MTRGCRKEVGDGGGSMIIGNTANNIHTVSRHLLGYKLVRRKYCNVIYM